MEENNEKGAIVLYQPEGEVRLERHGYCHVHKEYYIFGVEASL